MEQNYSDIEVYDMNKDMTMSAIPVIAFIGLVAVLGIIGNFVVIYIYSNKYPKCNFKYFVLLLAGIDLLSCIVLMPLEIVTFLFWFIYPASWLCKLKSFLNAFTVCASASSLMLIAIDRFRKVCKPHSSQIQPAFAVKLSALVLVLACIPATSDAVFWGLHTFNTDYNGVHVKAIMCEKDDKYKDTIYPLLHTVVLYGGTNVVVMIATLILYIFIAVKLFCEPEAQVTTPEITVTSDVDTGEIVENTGNVFQFGSDIESGISDSVDLDCESSKGSIEQVDQDQFELKDRNSNSVCLEEMVPLRKTPNSPDSTSSQPKTVRISIADNICYDDQMNGGLVEIGDGHCQLNNRASMTFPAEAMPLQMIRNCTNSSPSNRNSRASSEISPSEKKTHVLQIPDYTQRKKPRNSNTKSPPLSPTYRQSRPAYHRRRSTVASLSGTKGLRLRRKTLIMFVLTAVFISTTVLYFGLIGHMADSGDFFNTLTIPERTAWLFFLRLYFVNSLINPILYGFLDPRFRRALWNMGVHMTWAAGSLKRNLEHTIRRTSSGNAKHDITVLRNQRTSHLRPLSDTTVSGGN